MDFLDEANDEAQNVDTVNVNMMKVDILLLMVVKKLSFVKKRNVIIKFLFYIYLLIQLISPLDL